MKKLNFKKEVFFSFLVVLVILFLLVFISYKDFYGLNQTSKKVLSSIRNVSHEENSFDNSIYIDKRFILSDDDGRKLKGYNFIIYNSSNNDMKYNLYLKEDSSLIDIDNCSLKKIGLKYIKYSINGNINTLDKVDNYIIYSGNLLSGERKKINLKVWVDSSYNIYSNHLHLKFDSDSIYGDNLLEHMKLISSDDKYSIDSDSALKPYKTGTDYKYIGSIPNNYIYFNCKNSSTKSCELWRIVGTSDVLTSEFQKEKAIKIVREKVLSEEYKYNDIKYEINNPFILNTLVYKNESTYNFSNFTLLNEKDYLDSLPKKCIGNCDKVSSYLKSKYNEWLIGDNNNFMYLNSDGYIHNCLKSDMYYFRPCLYLNKDVKVRAGTGSIEFPYIIY